MVLKNVSPEPAALTYKFVRNANTLVLQRTIESEISGIYHLHQQVFQAILMQTKV